MWAVYFPSYNTGVTAAKAISILQGEKGHCSIFLGHGKSISRRSCCAFDSRSCEGTKTRLLPQQLYEGDNKDLSCTKKGVLVFLDFEFTCQA